MVEPHGACGGFIFGKGFWGNELDDGMLRGGGLQVLTQGYGGATSGK